MAERNQRINRFKIEHPKCFFCATASTETEDHVPSRECFRDRVGPEGFAFPACAKCNNSAGQYEQVVALYMMLADHENTEPSGTQLWRLLKGVKNNNPDLMPSVEVSARAARKHFSQQGHTLQPGDTYAGVPLLSLPVGNRDALELFARRLACALFYREVGFPVPLENHIATAWTAWSHPNMQQVADRFRDFLPNITVSNRVNTDIGSQFLYLWSADVEQSVFAFAAQFRQSFLFFGGVTAPHLLSDNFDQKWKPHHGDIP